MAHVEKISTVLHVQVTCYDHCSLQHRVWEHSQCQARHRERVKCSLWSILWRNWQGSHVNSGNSEFAYLCIFRCRDMEAGWWSLRGYTLLKQHDLYVRGGWLVAIKEQSVWEDVESVVRPAGSNFLVLLEMRFFNLSWWYLSLESYCIQLKLCHLSLGLSFIWKLATEVEEKLTWLTMLRGYVGLEPSPVILKLN